MEINLKLLFKNESSLSPLQIQKKYQLQLRLFTWLEKRSAATTAVWQPHASYYFDNEEEFKLEHLIIKRKRKPGKPQGFRYEVVFMTDQIGSGGFSTVLSVYMTVIFVNDKFIIKLAQPGAKERVLKLQKHIEEDLYNVKKKQGQKPCALNPLKNLDKEYAMQPYTPHLGMKEPVCIELEPGRTDSYLIMKRVPGIDLFSMFVDEYNIGQTKFMSDRQRNYLAYAVLVATEEQVCKLNLVHGDLKPENYLVVKDSKSSTKAQLKTKQQSKAIANIVDFAMAEKIIGDEEHYWEGGSLIYCPPEFFTTKMLLTPMRDAFALGRILAFIYHGPKAVFSIRHFKLAKDYSLQPGLIIDNLFDYPTTMTAKKLVIIREEVAGLLCIEPDKRWTVKQAIAQHAKLITEAIPYHERSLLHDNSVQQMALRKNNKLDAVVHQQLPQEENAAVQDKKDNGNVLTLTAQNGGNSKTLKNLNAGKKKNIFSRFTLFNTKKSQPLPLTGNRPVNEEKTSVIAKK